MELLLWITTGFSIIGFIVLASMKGSMESKLAFIKGDMESEKSSAHTKSIVWWIRGTVAWGIVSIFLVVWWFSTK